MKIMMALAGLDIGGAETHVVELSKEMKRRGHEVVMISGGGVYQKEAEAFGIKHYTVPVKERNYANIVRAYRMIKKIIVDEKPELVHSHARIPSFIIGMIHRSLKASFVYVTTVHGAFDTSFVLRSLTHWGEKTLAVSDDLKQYLVKNYRVSPKNTYISINGIDNGKFNESISPDKIMEEFSLNPSAKRIVYVSRLEEDVCAPVYCIMDSLKELSKKNPDIEFIIVGGGKAFSSVSRKAYKVNKALGRKAVILTGQRTDVNEIHATADVCIGVSRAILEPMAMKKPCIIAGQEGYIGVLTPKNLTEAIDCNFTCRGCAPLDYQKLTEDIASLFEMPHDELTEIAEFGKSVVESRYSVQKMADDNEKMYAEAFRDHTHNTVMVGYYGYGNRGDDALLAAIINDMREKSPDFSPMVLSRNPKSTTETYGVKSINRFNLPAIHRAMKSADLFLAGGGSLIQDVTSTRSLLYYLFCLRYAKKHGLKVMLYANGIGPVTRESNRRKTAEVLDRVDVITLRDTDSADYLKKFNVTSPEIYITGDPAFGLTECDIKGAAAIIDELGIEGSFVAVSVRNINGAGEKFVAGFARMMDYIYEKYGLTALFVPMQLSKDKKISLDIISRMQNKAYFADEDIDVAKIMGIVSRSEAIIAVRLHMLLFGAAMSVPVLGINYDPKVKSNVMDIGIGDCIEPEEITDLSYKERIDNFLKNRMVLRESMPEKLKCHKAKAKENADIAINLMKGNK